MIERLISETSSRLRLASTLYSRVSACAALEKQPEQLSLFHKDLDLLDLCCAHWNAEDNLLRYQLSIARETTSDLWRIARFDGSELEMQILIRLPGSSSIMINTLVEASLFCAQSTLLLPKFCLSSYPFWHDRWRRFEEACKPILTFS